jgi:hypothetical protein
MPYVRCDATCARVVEHSRGINSDSWELQKSSVRDMKQCMLSHHLLSSKVCRRVVTTLGEFQDMLQGLSPRYSIAPTPTGYRTCSMETRWIESNFSEMVMVVPKP